MECPSTFGLEIAKLFYYDQSLVKKIYLNDKKLIAKRPFDMRMDVNKFEKNLILICQIL